jgi:hypothetical protein
LFSTPAPREDKIDDIKDSFYEELKRVFDKFPKYHMKILLGDFTAKVRREDIFKLTIGLLVDRMPTREEISLVSG